MLLLKRSKISNDYCSCCSSGI